MYTKKMNKKKTEDGQAMLEFVLVFPIFMLLMALILDFGWLFYNQIQLENATRNAARVACVEYTEVALNKDGVPYSTSGGKCEYDLAAMKDKADPTRVLSEQETSILNEVKNAQPSSAKNFSVTVLYTYDEKYIANASVLDFDVNERANDDVVIIVKADHKAISPIVGWDDSDGSRMSRVISAKSVYKVEKS